jgi:hypothetical protein
MTNKIKKERKDFFFFSRDFLFQKRKLSGCPLARSMYRTGVRRVFFQSIFYADFLAQSKVASNLCEPAHSRWIACFDNSPKIEIIQLFLK